MSQTPANPIASELEADIARTRAELAETVDQLAARLDVKTRVRDRFVAEDGRPRPAAYVVGGVVGLVVGALVLRKVRRSR